MARAKRQHRNRKVVSTSEPECRRALPYKQRKSNIDFDFDFDFEMVLMMKTSFPLGHCREFAKTGMGSRVFRRQRCVHLKRPVWLLLTSRSKKLGEERSNEIGTKTGPRMKSQFRKTALLLASTFHSLHLINSLKVHTCLSGTHGKVGNQIRRTHEISFEIICFQRNVSPFVTVFGGLGSN